MIVLIPLVYLGIRAGGGGWATIESTLRRPQTMRLLRNTLSLTAVVTASAVVLGVGCAWLVSATDLAFGRFWRVVFALPLALPSYVAGWAWISYRPGLAGFWGATLVLTTISYPYVYLPVLAALRSADPGQVEVARSLGLSAPAAFLRVTLRQIRIAASGGALLVALYTLSEFGAVSIMRFDTLTSAIYHSYRASFDRTPAAVLGCVLVLISLVPLFIVTRTDARNRVDRVGAGARRRAPTVRLGRVQGPALLAAAGLLVVCLGVPAANLARWLRDGRSQADWSEVLSAAVTTLSLAAMAGLATVVIAFPVALLAARHPGWLSRNVTAIAYAGHALPGVVVALSLVFFGVRFAYPIYQRTPMLLFAYVVLFMSLAIGAIHQAIATVPPVLDEVARSLGRTQGQAWRQITARLAAPGIGSGAVLVMLATAKELPATLLLRPIGTSTLATQLWSHTDAAAYSAAAPFAAGLVLVATIPTAILTMRGRELR